MRSFFSVLLVAFPLLLWAQRGGNPQKTYQSGKEFYNSGQYHMAAETFKSLTTYTNTFTEYATFYYGLSSYHNGQAEIAKNILLQLSRKYPGWKKNSEAYFWLAKLYFEKEDYALALDQLDRIKQQSMDSDVSALKKHYLTEAPVEVLEELYGKYPEDAELAECLARAMGQQPLSNEQLDQLQEIIETFNLSEDEITNQIVGQTTRKDSYKVAVCFPFMVSDLKEDMRLNSNQWVLDLYQGIQLGQQKLVTENIGVELYAYDTERDSLRMAEILAMDEMRSMDLIIGPLYPAPSELASNFAFNQKLNILNPLSSNTDIISHNPYSFLFHPTDQTLAKVAANFIKDSLSREKKTLIVYGSREGDSIAALQYREVLLENGIEVIMMDQIPTVDPEAVAKFVSDNLYEIFTPAPDDPAVLLAKEKKKEEGIDEEEEEDDEFIPRSDIDHIFVASSNELIVANVIGTIDNMGPELSIMGNGRWLQSKYMDFKQMERLQVYMTAPEFVDYTSNKFKEFERKYRYRYKSIPNRYSFIGYELMLLFGNFLQQGGNYFQHEVRRNKYYPGAIFTGYSYAEGNDNSYVPIVKFEEGVLTQINK